MSISLGKALKVAGFDVRDHEQSYHSFMHKHLFAHIDIDPKNVHLLDGNAENLEAECEKYEEEIRKVGGIELFLGGTITLKPAMLILKESAQMDTSHLTNLEVVLILAHASRLWYRSLPRMALTERHMTPSSRIHDSSTMTSHLFQKWRLQWEWEQSWTQEK